jgi:hypothetical protein
MDYRDRLLPCQGEWVRTDSPRGAGGGLPEGRRGQWVADVGAPETPARSSLETAAAEG